MASNGSVTRYAVGISDRERADIVRDLTAVACAHGETEPQGTAPRAIKNLRSNVRAKLNAAIPTLVTLLSFNGRADEFSGKLHRLVPRVAVTGPIREILLVKTDTQCDEMREAARILAGDESSPELHTFRARVVREILALELIKESIDATLAERATLRAA